MKRKYWFEKIDATSTLPNFYPYREDSSDVRQSEDFDESVPSIFEHCENVVTLKSWTTDYLMAV